MNSFTATVATRPCTTRVASTAAALSTCAMTQPPKISPLELVSEGMGMTLSTSSLSTGRLEITGGEDMAKHLKNTKGVLSVSQGRRALAALCQLINETIKLTIYG